MNTSCTSAGSELSAPEKAIVLHACYVYHYLNDAITFILPTVMGLLYNRFSLNWIEAGIVYAMNLLVMIVFQVIMGYFSDIVDQKKIMLVGMALLGGSTILMMLSVDFASLLLFATLLGIGLGIQHASSYSISSRIKNEKVNRQAAAGDMGKGSAIIVSTLLVFFLNNDLSWRIPFLAWGIATLVAMSIIAFKFREFCLYPAGFVKGKQTKPDIPPVESRKATVRKIFALTSFFLLFMLYSAQFQVISNNLTTYMAEYKGFETKVSPFFFVVFFLLAITGSSSSLALSKRVGKKRLVVTSYIVYLVVLVLYVLLDPRESVTNAIFCAVMAFFSYTVYPVILETMSGKTPRTHLGLAFGIVMGLGWVGGFVASLLAGYFAQTFTAQSIFYISIISVILSLVVLKKTGFT
nr:MFS transporter [Candidatus Sigynarchaeota archaeon]